MIDTLAQRIAATAAAELDGALIELGEQVPPSDDETFQLTAESSNDPEAPVTVTVTARPFAGHRARHFILTVRELRR